MRLLLRDAIPRQKVNNRLCLDLEFAGQFVDSDLVCFAHASYRPFHGQKSAGLQCIKATRCLRLWLFFCFCFRRFFGVIRRRFRF